MRDSTLASFDGEPGLVTYREVEAAAERLQGRVHRTPVLTSSSLDGELGAQLFFKAEALQCTGAFKARGATNAVACLSPEMRARGVATHSSGNHGAALAWAAAAQGIPCSVVMPRASSGFKRRAVVRYGAEVVPCGDSQAGREEATVQLLARTGAQLIHPYDDPRIIAGQGTATLELLQDVPRLDLLVVPVGGGGLISGAAVVTNARAPGCRLVGAEPAGADDAIRSLAAGEIRPCPSPMTVADGLRATISPLTFAHLRRYVERIVPVTEEEIVTAMRTLWERLKLLVEPSSAVVLAAIANGALDIRGCRAGLILSGGNVDLDQLPWVRAAG